MTEIDVEVDTISELDIEISVVEIVEVGEDDFQLPNLKLIYELAKI